MKKYLFMALALCAFATTTVTLTSCEKNDEEVITIYALKGSVSIYDPKSELSSQQKSDLQAIIKKVGDLNVTNAKSESELKDKTELWVRNLATLFDAYSTTHPELAETSAGIMFTFTGNGTKYDYIFFNPNLNPKPTN